jgi:hypothetical protein
MFIIRKNILLIILLMVLYMLTNFVVGCASTGSHREMTSTTTKLSNYKTILVNVSSNIPDSSLITVKLGSMIVAELEEKKIFDDIFLFQFTPHAAAELGCNVKILDLRKVSDFDRAIVGGLAGQARIATIVEIVDLKSNTTINKFEAVGKSSGGSFLSGVTAQAIERTAEEIAEYIYENL